MGIGWVRLSEEFHEENIGQNIVYSVIFQMQLTPGSQLALSFFMFSPPLPMIEPADWESGVK